MPKAQRPAWTTWRKLVGNLVPLSLSLPLLVLGARGYPATGLTGSTLWYLLGFLGAAWMGTNLLGLCGSWGLKEAISRRLHQTRPFDRTEKWFVGFARPDYRGLLDAHQDVGLFMIHPDRLEFLGTETEVELTRSDVRRVCFRANPHTLVGLGRWVSIEGESQGKAVRLLVEPRERTTMLGNLFASRTLRRRLAKWIAEPPILDDGKERPIVAQV